MPLFRTGPIVMTRGIAVMASVDPVFRIAVNRCLERHCSGDWGDLDDETRQQNDDALEAEKEGRHIDSLFSLYDIDGTEIYIITEIDRSVTTILLPEEY